MPDRLGGCTSIFTGTGSAPQSTWLRVQLRYTGTATGGGQIWIDGLSQPDWSASADLSNTAPFQLLHLWNDKPSSQTDFDEVRVETTSPPPPPPPPSAPTVTAISPTSGPAAGGTVVTISGTGFSTTAGATTARFGATAATGVSCASTTSCSATSPAGSGTVDVTVTVGGATSATTPADRFRYRR